MADSIILLSKLLSYSTFTTLVDKEHPSKDMSIQAKIRLSYLPQFVLRSVELLPRLEDCFPNGCRPRCLITGFHLRVVVLIRLHRSLFPSLPFFL
jgi:hypothetical protein